MATQRRVRVLGLFLLAWLLLCCAIPFLRLNNTIDAFFPDLTPEARALCRGMHVATGVQSINIDLYSATGDADSLIHAADSLRRALSPMTKMSKSFDHERFKLEASLILHLLPSLFDSAIQRQIEASLEPAPLATAVKSSLSALVSFPLGDMTEWVRYDPLGWRNILRQRLPQAANSPHVMQGEYPTITDSTGGLHLLVRLEPTTLPPDAHSAVSIMDACETALKCLPKDITATMASGLRHTAANTRCLDRDITWIAAFSLIGLVLVYAILVRSWGAVWLFVTPLVAVSASLGVMSLSFSSLSGLALGFGAGVLGIAEDYAVHSHFALRSQPDKTLALTTLTPPLTQGLLLNTSGFAVLLFSSIPALRQLAAFGLLALCMGFAMAVLVLPLLPGFDRPAISTVSRSALSGPHRPRLPRAIPVYMTVLTLCVFCVFLWQRLPKDTDPRRMGAEAQTIMHDAQTVARTWHNSQQTLVLLEDDSLDASLVSNARLLKEIRTRWPNSSTWGSADLLPPAAVAKENCHHWQEFMQKHGLHIAHALKQATQSMGMPSMIFTPFMETLTASPEPVSPDMIRQHITENAPLMASLFREFPATNDHPAISQSYIATDAPLDLLPPEHLHGGVLLTTTGIKHVFDEAFAHERRYLPLTLLLCVILLHWNFGNIRQSLLALLPPLASLATILTGLLLLGEPLTIAHLAALPLVFGLAVDHGIMVTHDLANGIPLGIERAIVVSSLTACTGMGLLAFATHPALQALGHIIFLGLFMEVPTSLWLLPIFCKEQS
ncbi:MAG: hypothetical protein J5861_03610 [Desulfovibrio sp.]|nr:hypothetical protein [Desulfovibrio sp.]